MLTAILKFFVSQFMVFVKTWLAKRKIEGDAKDELAEGRKRRDRRAGDVAAIRDEFRRRFGRR